MGAFFTNVQVRSQDADAIARAIREDARERAMDELEPASDLAPDRAVLILPAKDGWIAIYDEATEGQDATSLERIAVAASRAAQTHAFSVAIHDSDVLDLRLYREGARLDRLDSYPGYFGEKVSKKKRDEVAGDPAQWSALADPAKLREAWSAEDLFAERTLARTCEIVGCDVRRAATGYRYTIGDRDELPEGTITLRFRSRARPAWESESGAPPELVTESYVEGVIALAVGDELRVSLGARSAGRASQGVGIRCWGSALEQGLVEVERFELLIGHVLKDCVKDLEITPERSRSKDGALLLVADRPALTIPAGSAEPFAGFTPGMDFMKAMDAMQRSKVHVNVVGKVIAAGKGEIGIGLVPLARSEAAAGTIARLAIDPPLAQPLRVRTDLGIGASSHLLRPLAGDRYLVAMIGIDAPRSELARRAREAMEIVRGVLSDADAVSTAIYFSSPGKRPKSGAGKVKTLLRGKRWDDLVAAIESEQVVTITAGPVTLSAGTSILPDREEDRMPWLAVSVDAQGRDVSAIRERLSAMFDELMRGPGAQAVIARTGWNAGMIDPTPYEQACTIAHNVGTLRAWSARWVRVPGNDRLWLSKAMAARVDRGALGEIAELDAIGEGLRISLRDRAEWPRLESAIAELLPTMEESQRTSAEHYRAR